ncbi:MAG: Uma2 family endonuclease [Lachnospiraceae bacterium]|nr:Uma2 family endonuclease [Lachnospiraceae bacterium]
MKEMKNQKERSKADETKTEFDQGHREEELLYGEWTDLTGADLLREPETLYAYKRQGEYTLEDYYALPDDRRVELIDGVFFDMEAPGADHQTAAMQIVRQLDEYIDTQGGSCMPFVSPIDVQLDCDDRTMVEPDVVLLCDMKKNAGHCIYGAPDLVMEVLSQSTFRKDQTLKLSKYRNAGVREYWIIDLKREKVTVYDFEHQKHPAIYGMDVPIPVGIYDGKCEIRFDRYFARMKMLNQE